LLSGWLFTLLGELLTFWLVTLAWLLTLGCTNLGFEGLLESGLLLWGESFEIILGKLFTEVFDLILVDIKFFSDINDGCVDLIFGWLVEVDSLDSGGDGSEEHNLSEFHCCDCCFL